METYNKLTIIGHLGHNPEMRYLADGTALTRFDVAVNQRRQGAGQPAQRTQWFHVVCYGTLAERAADQLRQGRSVYVAGPLVTRDYMGAAGQKRLALDVRARELQVLDPPTRQGAAPPPPVEESPEPGDDLLFVADQDTVGAPDDDLDQVPF